MKKYVCDVCGYIYDEAAGDPDNGIAPGTKWEDLPDDFECPLCGVGRTSSVWLRNNLRHKKFSAYRRAENFFMPVKAWGDKRMMRSPP